MFRNPLLVSLFLGFFSSIAHCGEVSPLVGKPAPDFSLLDLDGKKVRLGDLKGRTVVLLFWAAWCPPSVKSLPVVLDIVKKEKVLCYAPDYKETVQDIQKFQKGNGLTFRVLMDTYGAVSQSYQTSIIPETVVIDKAGIIRAVHVGYDDSLKAELTRELAALERVAGKN